MKGNKATVKDLLSHAGIAVNQPNSKPWDIIVHNDAFYEKMLQGSLAIGESYMDGDWDCGHIDQLIDLAIRNKLSEKVKNEWAIMMQVIIAKFFNFQSCTKAITNVYYHYDIGNDLYEMMLGKDMMYTCAYWDEGITTLEQAQNRKMQIVCQKLQLEPGMRVLDIGCGWGGFARYAAEHYDVSVDGITISQEQLSFAQKYSEKYRNVNFYLMDYRDVVDKYDAIVSLGMFEHVGPKNYRIYMEAVARNLTDEGIFLLHTIGAKTATTVTDPWLDKYIFPGTVLPSLSQITTAAEDLFIVEDVHNFGAYYDRTLMAWHDNFEKSWPSMSHTYDVRFYRMWKYYLLLCAGSFRARYNQLWQIVLTKEGVLGVYPRIG